MTTELTGGLRALVADAESPMRSDRSEFVASGLRAARVTRTPSRHAILDDIAKVLNCAPSELSFLYADRVDVAANDTTPVHMPSFRDALRSPSLITPALLAAE